MMVRVQGDGHCPAGGDGVHNHDDDESVEGAGEVECDSDSSCVVVERDQAFDTEFSSLILGFFSDFGMLIPEDGVVDQSVFNQIFQLIQRLKLNMINLKTELGYELSGHALKAYNIAMDGIKEMLNYADKAKTDAMWGAGFKVAGAGVTIGGIGYTGYRNGGLKNVGQGELTYWSTMGSSLGGGIGGFFDASSSHAQSDSQIEGKGTDADVTFLTSLMDFLKSLDQSLTTIWTNVSGIHGGTVKAEGAYRFRS